MHKKTAQAVSVLTVEEREDTAGVQGNSRRDRARLLWEVQSSRMAQQSQMAIKETPTGHKEATFYREQG